MLLITNDRENKRKASEEGIPAETGAHSHLLFFNDFWEWIYEVVLLLLCCSCTHFKYCIFHVNNINLCSHLFWAI